MTIYINGTSGISGVDGSAGTPAIQGTDGNTGISFPAADTVAINTGGSERTRVDSSGRLLVGTSTAYAGYGGSADNRFQIAGSSYTTGALSAFVFGSTPVGGYLNLGLSRNTTVGSHTVVQNGDGLGAITFNGSDGTNFETGAIIAADVDGTPGNNDMPCRLVFYTTADGASSPTERMRISSAGIANVFSSNQGFNSRISTAAGTTEDLYIGRHSATNTQDGTISFAVRANGNVVNTNNSYGAISDIKLKKNIVDANSQWDDLKALQVRNYNFKEGQTHTQIGLIAQEVELVSPGLVTESPDRDAEGNDLGTVTKSVNYSVLYMKAVKALQEAMERIEQLETEMAAVKAQLA